MGVWRRCFGGAVSPVYVHCGTLLNTPIVVFLTAVYAGESSTNSTRECFIFLFADAVKRNFQGFSDEDCQQSFQGTKEIR